MTATEKIDRFQERVMSSDQTLLDEVRRNGLFDAFRVALEKRVANGMPRNIVAFYFHALRTRVERSVTPAVRAWVGDGENGAALHFAVSQGVGFVFLDGELWRIGLAREMLAKPNVQPKRPVAWKPKRPALAPAPILRTPLDPLAHLADDLCRNPRSVMDLFRATGAFTLFERVVQHKHRGAPLSPRTMERYFGDVIRERDPRPVPRVIRRRLEVCLGTRVDYFVGRGIGIVVVNGVIKDFVVAQEIERLEVTERTSGRPSRPRHKREPIRGPDDPLRVGTSIVAREGPMAAELRLIAAARRGQPRG